MHIRYILDQVAKNDSGTKTIDFGILTLTRIYLSHRPGTINLDDVTNSLRNNNHVHTVRLSLSIPAQLLIDAIQRGRKNQLTARVTRFVDMLESKKNLTTLMFAVDNSADNAENDETPDYPQTDLEDIMRPLLRIFSWQSPLLHIHLPKNCFLPTSDIINHIPFFCKLESLDLSENNLNIETTKELVDRLKERATKLKRLNLSRNPLKPEEMALILDSVYTCKKLEELDLSDYVFTTTAYIKSVIFRGLNAIGIPNNSVEHAKEQLRKRAASLNNPVRSELLWALNRKGYIPYLPETVWVNIFKYAGGRSKRFEFKI